MHTDTSFNVPSQIIASPTLFYSLLEKRIIFVGSADNNLYALCEGLSLLWKYETAGPVTTKAIVSLQGAALPPMSCSRPALIYR